MWNYKAKPGVISDDEAKPGVISNRMFAVISDSEAKSGIISDDRVKPGISDSELLQCLEKMAEACSKMGLKPYVPVNLEVTWDSELKRYLEMRNKVISNMPVKPEDEGTSNSEAEVNLDSESDDYSMMRLELAMVKDMINREKLDKALLRAVKSARAVDLFLLDACATDSSLDPNEVLNKCIAVCNDKPCPRCTYGESQTWINSYCEGTLGGTFQVCPACGAVFP